MDSKLSEDIINQIKNFGRYLTQKQELLIDKLIPNEELKNRYKKYGLCKECNQPNNGRQDFIKSVWCQSCNSKHFQQDFNKWTSGNQAIDEFIQKCQLEAINPEKILEWIPYDKFINIEYLATGGFGTVFKAKWIDGQILNWNVKDNKWERKNTFPNGMVALKSLNNSQDINVDFLHEITRHKLFGSDAYVYDGIVRCHGISQDPKTQNSIMVMGYVPGCNLRQYLNQNRLTFKSKLNQLLYIAMGLKNIHDKGLIHKDFHSGNILKTVLIIGLRI